jgi:hypothetical protein
MASSEMTVFEQFLAYDMFGILVKDSRDTYYFPWHAILYVS